MHEFMHHPTSRNVRTSGESRSPGSMERSHSVVPIGSLLMVCGHEEVIGVFIIVAEGHGGIAEVLGRRP